VCICSPIGGRVGEWGEGGGEPGPRWMGGGW